jgi:monooxygenase
MMTEHVNVVIVGAGLSGIGAAVHLQTDSPNQSYLILEARAAIGGTWDLFRYPGVRSDSDMYTLGYAFKPWTDAKAIADGPAILDYVVQTAREHGIDQNIRYGARVKRASWSSAQARWTLTIEQSGKQNHEQTGKQNPERASAPADDCVVTRLSCNFLLMCSGYYSYENGYTPEFPGVESFAGRLVHPQQWTDDIDYSGQRVVVIGSGATAVTLVPELAKKAAHVVMLQRSPTYVVSRPSEDKIANTLRRFLPARLAYGLTRWKNVLFGMYIFNLCRKKPLLAKQGIIQRVRDELGADFDVARHFTPRYNPWEQRLCLVPDSDLFNSLKSGRASVVTDQIERFTRNGILLASGTELAADLIVTATGLNLQFLGGLNVIIDGKPLEAASTLSYKGMMYRDVPNLASVFGYTNASWTLKADLTCAYVCRLINHMQKTGNRQCVPRLTDNTVVPEPWIDFSSGYFQRALGKFPLQGSKQPWKLHQNYARDLLMLKFGAVADDAMEFST